MFTHTHTHTLIHFWGLLAFAFSMPAGERSLHSTAEQERNWKRERTRAHKQQLRKRNVKIDAPVDRSIAICNVNFAAVTTEVFPKFSSN